MLGLAAACAAGGDTGVRPGQLPDTDPDVVARTQGGSEATLSPAAGLLFGLPIYRGDFADPYVLRVGDVLYAYATNTPEANLPVIVVDGGSATSLREAFPHLPSWTVPGFVWAPAVLGRGGHFVLYYSTRLAGTTTQCISRAVSDEPTGPFVDDSTGPMVCQRDLGGSIDPSLVTDLDGTDWLLYKSDGNCCGLPTALWSQRLAEDGLSVVGTPTKLLTADAPWQAGLIEGPSMVIDGSHHLLFYSGNSWDSVDYGIGYADCRSITGPCADRSRGEPWMSSTPFAKGPGGQEFFTALDRIWMVFHAWSRGETGRAGAARHLYLDGVDFHDGVPQRIGSPSAARLVAAALVGVAAVSSGVVWWVRLRRRRAVVRDAEGA